MNRTHLLLLVCAPFMLTGCPDTPATTPTADVGADAPAAGPCPGGATDNGCGGCAELSEAIGRPGTLCTTDDGFEGVSTCDGIDAVTCEALAQNGCGGAAVLDGKVRPNHHIWCDAGGHGLQ